LVADPTIRAIEDRDYFEAFEQKVEATIQEALNKNMMKLIAIMGAFIALFKIIDKF